jgi:hypothetical protein
MKKLPKADQYASILSKYYEIEKDIVSTLKE